MSPRNRLIECPSCGGLRRFGNLRCPHCDRRFAPPSGVAGKFVKAAGLSAAVAACGGPPPRAPDDQLPDSAYEDSGQMTETDGNFEGADAYGVFASDGNFEGVDAYGVPPIGEDAGRDAGPKDSGPKDANDFEGADAYGVIDAGQWDGEFDGPDAAYGIVNIPDAGRDGGGD